MFYYTHRLFYVYVALLILHCPNFWKWFIVPGIIYIFELVRRTFYTRNSKFGDSTIHQINPLTSRVTELTIRRPEYFDFKVGDWVFVKIPHIAKDEWHPFTISSAPEQKVLVIYVIERLKSESKKIHFYPYPFSIC